MSAAHDCRYCDQRHKPRYLCDPAKKVLDALYARGQSFNMPDVEFPEPLPMERLGMGLTADDQLVSQLVVQAATLPVAGVTRPMLIFTGRSAHGRTLPRWLYSGEDADMTNMVDLVTRMTGLAVRTAAAARAGTA